MRTSWTRAAAASQCPPTGSTQWAPDRTSSAAWDAGSVTLTSNKNYWGDNGQIGTIKFVTYDHPQTRLQALLDGKIDGYDAVTVGNFDQLVKSGKQIIQRDPFSVMYLGMNQEVPILQDLKVRQAIEMAIDKDTLIRRFFIDNTTQASQFVPPKLSGFNNNAPALGYDPGKAKELLAEAGYKGQELKFYYPLNVTRPYLPTPEKVYAEISRQLTAVGLNIKPVPVDWADGYLQKVTSPGDHALHLLGWNGSYSDPDNFVGPLFGAEDRRVRLPGSPGLLQDRPGPGHAGRPGPHRAVPDHQCADRGLGAGGSHRLPDLGPGALGPGFEVPGLAGAE